MKDTRRIFIKKLGYSIGLSSIYFTGLNKVLAQNNKSLTGISKKFIMQPNKSRVWLGEDFWAIPMEDWSLKDGKITFKGDLENARVNVLTTFIEKGNGSFKLKTLLGTNKLSKEVIGAAGFLIGVHDKLDSDVKAACYYGSGLSIGVSTAGYLVIGDQKVALPTGFDFKNVTLETNVTRKSTSTIISVNVNSLELNFTHTTAIDQDISGYFALVNNIELENGANFWFKDLEFEGEKLVDKPNQTFGPILWPMYTLHNGMLKMSVQMPPIADDDEMDLSLHIQKDGKWAEIQKVKINTNSYQGVFSINKWKANSDTPYKITYKNDGKTYDYKGTIKAEPNSGELRLAGLTCQQSAAYPYSPLVKNLESHNPDLLFFSGDQIYEENGGYNIKRTPERESVLSYLGKWYMFGWAFGPIMRNIPTVCTPDDHDVFHGNLWGEGGNSFPIEKWTVPGSRDAHGGYVQSPEMINVVYSTNCAHMPASLESDILPSGITTWHTEMNYGGVSFAIVSDRMFKSGPEEVRDGTGRIDHIKTPLKPQELEKVDLQFLGKMQMKFLEDWISDWKGSSMKVLLSQTLYANVGTHHGADKMFLQGDMDSGGWPKTQRDEVIRILRKGYAFHINGDQHLPFIVQYSVDEKRDGGWTFCTPAISTGYLRYGQPDLVNVPFTDRPAHALPNTGCYTDAFGNNNFVYAVGNPKDNWKNKDRYLQAQNKASGFGLITFNLKARSIKMDAYRFLASKAQITNQDQYPGWPLTINQTDNDGRNFEFYLPMLKISKSNQLVRVFNSKNELLNVLRLNGIEHQFKVPNQNSYYLMIGDGKNVKKITNLKGSTQKDRILKVQV